ncbi:MAG: SPFH domain-containing protein [Coriobacteriia bacterium]|nr:SPFH domain-containing protein [Coriobacteriia bacterium]MCL2870587.1 SPFH domain-containing protein [Coriobacteriia bacterium]
MGFIRAFKGAIGGTFADQWQDYLMPRPGVTATTGLFEAVPRGTNAGRGANTRGSQNIITNGSRIVVPEGTALVTLQEGAVTGLIAEPGGYIYNSDDVNSRSMFAGDGILGSTVQQAWDRFKFGGQPAAQHLAYYVNLKEIPNNRFGTQSVIYWDDAYLGAQAGATTRGTYTLKIVDPILFLKNFVPVNYLQANAPLFDFADMNNDAGTQLFNEVVGSLSAAFSNYTNDPEKGNRMASIQGDKIGFAQSLSAAVEDTYQWRSGRGLEIERVAIKAIEYDEDTKALLADVRRADALSGSRGNSFMQQSVARGMQAAGENPGAASGGMGMAFMGMGMGAAGNVMGGMQQPVAGTPQAQSIQGQPAAGPFDPQTGQPINPQPAAQFCSQTGQPLAPQQPVAQFCPQTGQPLQQQAPAPAQFCPQTGQPLNQPVAQQPAPVAPAASPAPAAEDDPQAKIEVLENLLSQGVITQEDFDAQKAKLLG